jgi:hypothetical protein
MARLNIGPQRPVAEPLMLSNTSAFGAQRTWPHRRRLVPVAIDPYRKPPQRSLFQ